MSANANGWHGPPIKADDEAKTGRLREEDIAEWRTMAPVPFGLLPNAHSAALQSLAGYLPAFAFAPCAVRFRPCNAFVDIE